MKNFLGLFILLLFNAAAFSQNGPKIQLTTDTVDYGNAVKGSDSGIRTIEVKNTGDAPLQLSDVKSTCSCITTTWDRAAIQPGKSAKIDVKYNMAPGPVRKTLTIHSNAVNYDGGVVPIKVKGDIKTK